MKLKVGDIKNSTGVDILDPGTIFKIIKSHKNDRNIIVGRLYMRTMSFVVDLYTGNDTWTILDYDKIDYKIMALPKI